MPENGGENFREFFKRQDSEFPVSDIAGSYRESLAKLNQGWRDLTDANGNSGYRSLSDTVFGADATAQILAEFRARQLALRDPNHPGHAAAVQEVEALKAMYGIGDPDPRDEHIIPRMDYTKRNEFIYPHQSVTSKIPNRPLINSVENDLSLVLPRHPLEEAREEILRTYAETIKPESPNTFWERFRDSYGDPGASRSLIIDVDYPAPKIVISREY